MMALTIDRVRQAYRESETSPESLIAELRAKAQTFQDHNIWIYLLTAEEQAPYLQALEGKDPATHPLWGIPFAIKDNIDLAGIPTTAACEAFAYRPEESAAVVQKLIDAGAIPMGKTNLDQFATGLNGMRSPYGPCKNAFNPDYISGGSSSGSAVAVALGLCCFSLGTDTAGSGRVPAAFNNLVGVKPTLGLLSARGMIPACRSLDCMTIFTLQVDDANQVLAVAEGFDSEDAYSRCNPFLNQNRHYGERAGVLKIGILPEAHLRFFGDASYVDAYNRAMKQLARDNIEFVTIDYTPFAEAARLLYEGPWVAERYLATLPLIRKKPDALLPVIREIIEPAGEALAVDLFKAQYRLQALKQACAEQLARVECLLTPTAGTCFMQGAMREEPIKRNSDLGYYTNFMNLLDLSAVAVPAGFAETGLPFGLTLAAPAFQDRALLSIARRLHRLFDLPLGTTHAPVLYPPVPATASPAVIDVLVCGAHLDGLPLNWQLRERGARLKTRTHTAPIYRMYALAGGPPFRPGLILDKETGQAIDVEIWSVPTDQFGSFVAGIPAPLGIGKVQVSDGSSVCGFICEPYGLEGAEEITHLGGWREYLALKNREKP